MAVMTATRQRMTVEEKARMLLDQIEYRDIAKDGRQWWVARSESEPGVLHDVHVESDGYTRCTCEAGKYDRLCWHVVGVHILRAERVSRGLAPDGNARLDAIAAANRNLTGVEISRLFAQ